MPSDLRRLEGKDAPPPPWSETDKRFKERMFEEKNWDAFKLERACYRFRGLPETWANRFAEQHFPPANFPIKAFRTGVDVDNIGLHKGLSALDMRTQVTVQLGIEGNARSQSFDGRVCSFSAAMDWVAENLCVRVVQQDAPSKMAWTYYETWSQTPASKIRFLERHMACRFKEVESKLGFDPGDGLSTGGEDVGISDTLEVSGALAGDSEGSDGEFEVAPPYESPGYEVSGSTSSDSS